MDFFDKNGLPLHVGDHIRPDEGRELILVSQVYVSDFQCECLFGQQIEDPLAFSPLTQDVLSQSWYKVEDL